MDSRHVIATSPVVAWSRLAWIMAMTALGVLFAYEVALLLRSTAVHQYAGYDYRTYMDAARDWLAGDGFYEAYQLAGPYPVVATEILYPPPILLLLVPFTVLPAATWWAVPLGIIGAVVWSLRPSRWGWVAVLACVVLPFPKGMSMTQDIVFNGNPGMWIAAAVALALRFPAAGPWVLLKPTLAPLALVGIRHRSWWVGLGAFVVACVAFLPMWPDYLTVLRNAQTAGPSVLYSIANVPLVAIPLVAWVSRAAAGRSPATTR